MARSGWSTSNFLRCSSAVATAVPVTIAAWGKTSITGQVQPLCGLYSSADGFPFNAFMLYVDNGTNGVAAGAGSAAVFRQAITSTTITANTWFHACGVWASATDRRAFLNGGGKVTEATNLTPAGINRTSIGAFDGSSVSSPFAPSGTGLIGEVAIWNVALTDAEVASLANGTHPFMVRPDKLIAYWPTMGAYSPEINLKSNTATMAVQGTLSQAAHPRVFQPSVRHATNLITTSAFTLAAAVGAFTLTGVAALKKITRTAAAGAYTLTGVAATLARGKTLVAAAGSYVLTGVAVAFPRAHKVVAVAGAYALTGVAATLNKGKTLIAAAGSYILTGKAVLFPVAVRIVAAAGAYALTGKDVVFSWVRFVLGSLRRRNAAPVLSRTRSADASLSQLRASTPELAAGRSSSPSLSLRRAVKAAFTRLRRGGPSLED